MKTLNEMSLTNVFFCEIFNIWPNDWFGINLYKALDSIAMD